MLCSSIKTRISNLKSVKISIIVFLCFLIQSDYLRAHHNGLFPDVIISFDRPVIGFNYFQENGLNGIKSGLSFFPITNQFLPLVETAGDIRLELQINDFSKKSEYYINFNLIDRSSIYFFDTITNFASSITFSTIGIEHSNQISTSIDWFKFKLGYGFGIQNSKHKDRSIFAGLNAGFSYSHFSFNNQKVFDMNKSFNGITPILGILLNYTNDWIKLKSNNEIKYVICNGNLLIFKPEIDASINLTKIFAPELDINDLKTSFIILNLAYKYSFLKSNDLSNSSNIFSLGLFYAL